MRVSSYRSRCGHAFGIQAARGVRTASTLARIRDDDPDPRWPSGRSGARGTTTARSRWRPAHRMTARAPTTEGEFIFEWAGRDLLTCHDGCHRGCVSRYASTQEPLSKIILAQLAGLPHVSGRFRDERHPSATGHPSWRWVGDKHVLAAEGSTRGHAVVVSVGPGRAGGSGNACGWHRRRRRCVPSSRTRRVRDPALPGSTRRNVRHLPTHAGVKRP